MNSEQCRVARAMMGWTLKQLSRNVRVAQRTISESETEGRIRPEVKSRIRSLFVISGIEFIEDDDGIGLKRRFNLDEYLGREEGRASYLPIAEPASPMVDAAG